MKELHGYCSLSCQRAHIIFKRYEEGQIKKAKKELRAHMMEEAFELLNSIMNLIKQDRMTEKLLSRINKEIEKVK